MGCVCLLLAWSQPLAAQEEPELPLQVTPEPEPEPERGPPVPEAPAQPPPSATPTAPPTACTTECTKYISVPQQPTAAPLVTHRELGGHHFPVALYVPPALTLSYFGVRAGIEYHSVPGYARDLSFFGTGAVNPTHLQTVNAAETVDVALRLHEYVALVGTAYGLARVGANEATLLGTGADYTYGGSLGLLVKLFRVASFQMAVRAEVGYFAGQQAGIIELFQDIGQVVQFNIEQLATIRNLNELNLEGRLDAIEASIRTATTAMLTPFRGTEYGGSLNMAQALGRMFGVQLALGLYGKSATYDIPSFDARTSTVTRESRAVDRLYPRLGVALDVDLAKVGVPLDLLGEYQLTRLRVQSDLPDDELDGVSAWTEHLVAFGVHYSGSLDLQLGLTAYILYGQNPLSGANAQASGDPLDVGTQFVFRYLR